MRQGDGAAGARAAAAPARLAMRLRVAPASRFSHLPPLAFVSSRSFALKLQQWQIKFS